MPNVRHTHLTLHLPHSNELCQTRVLHFLRLIIVLVSALLGITSIASANEQNSPLNCGEEIVSPKSNGFGVTFFGTSTFLLDDGLTQVLIDGFFTRPKSLSNMAPNPCDIRYAIARGGIKRLPVPKKATAKKICHNDGQRGLKLIIPAHGHYDHAMDAPTLALWSGAALVADNSIKRLLEAAKKLPPQDMGLTTWRHENTVPPFAGNEPINVIECGEFTITLLRSPHEKNMFSGWMNDETEDGFEFGGSVFSMKLGTPFNIHVKWRDKSMLIVPSAGVPDFLGVTADVVFLATGAQFLKSHDYTRKLWQKTVTSVGANLVYPIHYDNDRKRPIFGAKDFPYRNITFPRSIISRFQNLAAASRRSVRVELPPPWTAFNPFAEMDQ